MDHTVLPANTPCLPILRSIHWRSPPVRSTVADIQLQLTTHLSTSKGNSEIRFIFSWLVAAVVQTKAVPFWGHPVLFSYSAHKGYKSSTIKSLSRPLSLLTETKLCGSVAKCAQNKLCLDGYWQALDSIQFIILFGMDYRLNTFKMLKAQCCVFTDNNFWVSYCPIHTRHKDVKTGCHSYPSTMPGYKPVLLYNESLRLNPNTAVFHENQRKFKHVQLIQHYFYSVV